MRVTVFGATGKIGRLVVQQLLTAGHDVTTLVRNPAKLTFTHPRLTVLTGQLSDGSAVKEAINGNDAVISALGPSLNSKVSGTQLADGTHHIITAMDAAGVSRFIGLATPSVPDPHDLPTLKAKTLPVRPSSCSPTPSPKSSP
jgi:putative NADH-flavin reductase